MDQKDYVIEKLANQIKVLEVQLAQAEFQYLALKETTDKAASAEKVEGEVVEE